MLHSIMSLVSVVGKPHLEVPSSEFLVLLSQFSQLRGSYMYRVVVDEGCTEANMRSWYCGFLLVGESLLGVFKNLNLI